MTACATARWIISSFSANIVTRFFCYFVWKIGIAFFVLTGVFLLGICILTSFGLADGDERGSSGIDCIADPGDRRFGQRHFVWIFFIP